MSYAVQAPVETVMPRRRPVTVLLAAGLLALMALVGLGYAIASIAVAPGVVERFRGAAGSADAADLDAYVTGVWMVAALGAVLAVILFALYIVLALGLRRGSQASRVGTWVVCGLGVLFGCGTTFTVAAQRSGNGDPAALGSVLSDSYPASWIPLNVALAIAQMLGYLVVATLLAVSPGGFFGRGTPSVSPNRSSGAYVALPTYGSANAYPPGPFQPSQPPVPPAPTGPDDDYWARPSS
jgi:hypothetical protein